MNLYDDIFPMLDCQNNQEIQNKGIELANYFNDISVFVLPMHSFYNKNIWENCAKIISNRSDDELAPFLPDIIEWLQDLNWPGTFIIIERLKDLKGELLIEPYVQAVSQAMCLPEDEREWLDNLSILIENKDLSKRLNKDMYSKLKFRREEFWG